MQKYLVVVSGSASIHVVAPNEAEAREIIDQLCSSELDADRCRSLDEQEVAAVQSLANWEILDAWPDIWSDETAVVDPQEEE